MGIWRDAQCAASTPDLSACGARHVMQRHARAARTSSWCAMTPADQMSDSGPTLELSTSGAMNLQGSYHCSSTRIQTRHEQQHCYYRSQVRQHACCERRALQACGSAAVSLGYTVDHGAGRLPHQGVPSRPSSVSGSAPGSNGAARPKSIALSGAASSSLASMKLPGFTSRCRMWCEWHCASVRSTARMKLATCGARRLSSAALHHQ